MMNRANQTDSTAQFLSEDTSSRDAHKFLILDHVIRPRHYILVIEFEVNVLPGKEAEEIGNKL